MSVGKIGEFDVKGGSWSAYVDRLEMFFLVNAVKEELKLPTLIAVVGDEAYELLENLASPRKPKELLYKEAVALLLEHLQPTPSVHAERYRFRQRRQASDESVAAYVAELKKLARHCKFAGNLNDNLRDQFICGIRSDVIRQRLFAEEDTILFANAVKLATSLEAAERDAAAVEERSAGSIEKEMQAVHALSHGAGSTPRAAGQRQNARGARGGRAPSGPAAAAQRHASTARSGGGGGPARRSYYCGGCGATDHNYTACRFRDFVCSRCRRTGHLRRVCPERSGGNGRSAGGAANVQAGMFYGDAEAEEDQPELEDFHHLCLNDYRAV